MKAKEIKNLIDSSSKRGVVRYKGKDKRKSFDESINQKKIQFISTFIGDKIEEVMKILSVK